MPSVHLFIFICTYFNQQSEITVKPIGSGVEFIKKKNKTEEPLVTPVKTQSCSCHCNVKTQDSQGPVVPKCDGWSRKIKEENHCLLDCERLLKQGRPAPKLLPHTWKHSAEQNTTVQYTVTKSQAKNTRVQVQGHSLDTQCASYRRFSVETSHF